MHYQHPPFPFYVSNSLSNNRDIHFQFKIYSNCFRTLRYSFEMFNVLAMSNWYALKYHSIVNTFYHPPLKLMYDLKISFSLPLALLFSIFPDTSTFQLFSLRSVWNDWMNGVCTFWISKEFEAFNICENNSLGPGNNGSCAILLFCQWHNGKVFFSLVSVL